MKHWMTHTLVVVLLATFAAHELQADEKAAKDCEGCGSKDKERSSFCFCVLEEVVVFGDFSLYDADRYDIDECNSATCLNPTAVAHLNESGLPNLPQRCEAIECLFHGVPNTEPGLDDPKSHEYEPNIPDEIEDATDVIDCGYIECRSKHKVIRAKIFLVKLLENEQRRKPTRYVAFGVEVEPDHNSEPYYTTREVKPVERHKNLYYARVGGIVFHIVTVRPQL